MIVRRAMLVIVLAIAVPTAARDIMVPNGFLSGNEWNRIPETEKQGYAMGIVDGIRFGLAFEGNGETLSWLGPCVLGMTSDQVRAMLDKEIQAKPGEWHEKQLAAKMYRAFWESCPGSPKNAK